MLTLLSMLLVFLSGIGMWDAGYLTYFDLKGLIPPCPDVRGFNCGAVLESEWAHIGPIPLAALGFLYYATLFGVAILNIAFPMYAKKWALALQVLTTTGFIFSAFLVYLQASVLQTWCLYCVISAATTTGLFVISWLYSWLLRRQKTVSVVSDN